MKDPYIEENGTLRNKLGIGDYKELKKAECDIGFVKLITLENIKVEKYDSQLIKDIHKYIFEDIYDWAGEFRTVQIYKEEIVIPGISLNYANPQEIEKKLQEATSKMNEDIWNPTNKDEFINKLIRHASNIWKVHPFRDGNTRTTLAYSYLFAREHGIELYMGAILNELMRKLDEETGSIKRYSVRDKFVLASLDEKNYPEPEHLEKLFRKVAFDRTKKLEDREL